CAVPVAHPSWPPAGSIRASSLCYQERRALVRPFFLPTGDGWHSSRMESSNGFRPPGARSPHYVIPVASSTVVVGVMMATLSSPTISPCGGFLLRVAHPPE